MMVAIPQERIFKWRRQEQALIPLGEEETGGTIYSVEGPDLTRTVRIAAGQVSCACEDCNEDMPCQDNFGRAEELFLQAIKRAI